MYFKVLIISTLISVSATYISRTSPMSRFRGTSVFRPGVMLNRPIMYPMRLMTSHRPYVVYRNAPVRYAMKHITTSSPSRNIFGIPWKTTARIPIPVAVTPEYTFIRSPPSPPIVRTDGAIHTIPAPNLSLSEKPIVVADENDASVGQNGVKPSYEVTEIYTDTPVYIPPTPQPETSEFSKNNLATSLPISNDFGLPAVHIQHPQEFTLQTFTLPQQQNLPGVGEGIIIPPNALYHPDPTYIKQLQNQFLQTYPSVEFIPYNPEVVPQATQGSQPNVYIPQNEQLIKQEPIAFTTNDHMKNIVQRQTQEGSIQSIVPHAFTVPNITDNLIEVTTPDVPESNVTKTSITETQTEVSKLEKTEGDTIESNRTEFVPVQNFFENNNLYLNRSIPIYYAQIGQSVGNVVANGLYSSINDVKAASDQQSATDLDRKNNITISTKYINVTTESSVKLKESSERQKSNKTMEDYKNLIASPFEKPSESINIAYTLLRSPLIESNDSRNVSVIAGQLVAASVSEDKEFKKERELRSRQPYLKLFTLSDNKTTDNTSVNTTVVKAKIPPQSKLTFDDNTGEPVLRVYASYLDNPHQKQVITSKLANMKYSKESETKRQIGNINPTKVNALAGDSSQFGLKLRTRNLYIPLDEDNTQ